MFDSLKGYKTYVCGIVGLVVVGANALGWITEEQKMFFLELIGSTAILTLRAAISKP